MKRPLLTLLLLLLPAAADAAPQTGGVLSPDGQVLVECYLPCQLRQFNRGGTDGAGLCVFTSIAHAARYQNEPALFDFQALAAKGPGGGWPEKVDRMLKQHAPGVKYLQHTGGDVGFLKAVLATGRMPGVTYDGHDPHYSGSISHMVNLVHLDEHWACILDNNYPYSRSTKADNQLVWMTPAEFVQRWKGMGGGWAVVLLQAPPPPIPGVIDDDERTGPPGWTAPVYYWDPCGNPSQVFLREGASFLGGWDYPGGYWRPYSAAGDWGPAEHVAPFPVPAKGSLKNGPVSITDYGCRCYFAGQPEYSVNGVGVTRAEALDAVQQCPGPYCPHPAPLPIPKPHPTPRPGPSPSPAPSPLPDDSGLPSLTVIGSAQVLAAVKQDLASAPELQPWAGKVNVQLYPEGSPMLPALGLPSSGTHLIVQLPRTAGFPGRIVWHATTYDGPAVLAGGLARANPLAPAPAPVPSPAPVPLPLPVPPALGLLLLLPWLPLLLPLGGLLVVGLLLFVFPRKPLLIPGVFPWLKL
jgi:hypothetical protein